MQLIRTLCNVLAIFGWIVFVFLVLWFFGVIDLTEILVYGI